MREGRCPSGTVTAKLIHLLRTTRPFVVYYVKCTFIVFFLLIYVAQYFHVLANSNRETANVRMDSSNESTARLLLSKRGKFCSAYNLFLGMSELISSKWVGCKKVEVLPLIVHSIIVIRYCCTTRFLHKIHFNVCR